MYKVAKMKVRPRGQFSENFLLVPRHKTGSKYSDLRVHRLHESGLYSGECYISESQVEYLSEYEVAAFIAEILTGKYAKRVGRPRKRLTRNQATGKQLIEQIRTGTPGLSALVRAFALGSGVQSTMFNARA